MSGAIPNFDANGNLPAGDFWPSTADFEADFVAIAGSKTRTEIYGGFKRHRSALATVGVDLEAPCLLDGSFTTSKLDPGDVDLAVEVDGELYLKDAAIQDLLKGPECKAEWHCDAYPIAVFPPGHAHYAVTEGARAYWLKWFGRDRMGNPKGRVWAKVSGFR